MADIERKNAVTFKGNPLTLIGPEIKAGDRAPEFQLLAKDLTPVTLSSSKGKTRVFSVVPSLDTPVCELQTTRFNQEASKLPENILLYTVSMDLPFAQMRFCGAHASDKLVFLSDHRDASFGKAYGVLIKELRLLSRSVFVVTPDDKIAYVQYVKEITEHPDYVKVLDFLKKIRV